MATSLETFLVIAEALCRQVSQPAYFASGCLSDYKIDLLLSTLGRA